MLQLIGVNSKTETCFGTGLQNGASMIDFESTTIAKNVDPFRVGCTVVEHFATN